MSISGQPAQKTTKILDETDKCLERLREDVLPHAPYLVDFYPPHHALRLPPHLVENWRRTCPFDPDEEQLQYMTFLPHNLRGDFLLRTRGGWDDGEGKLRTEPAKRISGSSSGGLSPLPGQPPRKKMSYQEYRKMKMAGQNSHKTSPKPESNEKKEINGSHTNDATASKPESKPDLPPVTAVSQKETTKDVKTEAPHGQKRPADAMAESQDAKAFDVTHDAPPAKKVQTDTSRQRSASPPADEAKKSNVHGLPPMLSPTLPPYIEEQLAKVREAEVKPPPNPKPTKSTTSISKATTNGATKDQRSTGTQNGKDNKDVSLGKQSAASVRPSNSVPSSQEAGGSRSDSSQAGKRPATSGKVLGSKTADSEASKASVGDRKPNSEPQVPPETNGKVGREDRRELLFKIKIPKGLRRDCLRILKLQPRPRKIPTQPSPMANAELSRNITSSNGVAAPAPQQRKPINGDALVGKNEGTNKAKAAVPSSQTPKSGEKRQRAEDESHIAQNPSKRQKPSSIDLQRPHTPVGQSVKSPSLSNLGSSQKSHLTTPKQPLKSAAMSRIVSAEGEVRTPLSSSPGAPGSAEHGHNREARPTSSASAKNATAHTHKDGLTNGHDRTHEHYMSEFRKYGGMAKSLKRGADSLAKVGREINPDATARRRGLAMAIEATLCYMLAFTLKDEPARIRHLPGDGKTWESLLAYFKFLKSVTLDTEAPQLQGLFYQLEGVCRHRIQLYDRERREQDLAMGKTEAVSMSKEEVDNSRLCEQAWFDGTRMLTVHDLQEGFPVTWTKTSRSPVGREDLAAKAYGEGSFYLPLSHASTPMEAIRAGWSILGEWAENQDIRWEGKMGL
ncbi:MAG: hypothetical protein Q9174_001038 [Haloplaca sp. 1 TL-2023]